MVGCKHRRSVAGSLIVVFVLWAISPLPSFAQTGMGSSPMETPSMESFPDQAEEQEPDLRVSEEEQMQGVIDSKDLTDISLLRGELATVKVYSLTRLSITDPAIADIASVDADKIMIVGKAIGQTPFFVWDEYGKRTIVVRVYEESLLFIKNRIQKILKALDVEGITVEENAYEGKVMLMGELPKEKRDELIAALGSLSDRIVNLTKEEKIEDLIQIDMQIAELNTTLQKTLGFDWTTGSNSSLVLTYEEAIPTAENQLERFIKIGDFTRTSELLLTINNQIEEGNARVLSKPRVLVISGKEARFQVGGQYPIQSTALTGDTATTSVTFKDYGIIMTLTPTLADGKVNIEMNIEISDIDASVATPDQGSVAFTTRAASTTLLLNDRQTIVLAGLIKLNKNTTYRKVPFLGDLPLIGFFFRSERTPAAEKETEIVITLTPTVIPQIAPKETETVRSSPEKMESVKKETMMPKKEAAAEEFVEFASAPAANENIDIAKTVPAVEAATQEMPESQPSADPAMPARETAVVVDEPAPAESSIEFAEELAVDEDDSETLVSYVQSVQKKISEAITYPYEASENGWSGTVKLVLHILKDGTLDEVAVKESSGHQVFDKDAINTAQILSPYGAFPPELEINEIKVIVPIVYSQDAAALDVACQPAATSPSTETAYAEMVQQRLAQALLYPDYAQKNGWEGTVKLDLQILRDGTLAAASVKESSGNKMFDETALQAAKTLAPYSVFPPESELQDLKLTVPIVYSLRK